MTKLRFTKIETALDTVSLATQSWAIVACIERDGELPRWLTMSPGQAREVASVLIQLADKVEGGNK